MTTFYHATQLPLFAISKVCKTCHIEKPLDDFPKDAMAHLGHKAHCKPCYVAINREIHRKHYAAHPGYHKQYDATRKPYQRKYRHNRRAQDPEKDREKIRLSYAKHAESRREHGRQRYKANPLIWTESARRRDARKKQVTVGRVSYKRILERDGCWCHICEQPIKPGQEMHFDHVIPLDRGGIHSEENIKPSHKECNLRKGTHLLEEMTPFQRRGV